MFPPSTKFMVVDDFATMRKIIRKVLAELNYTVVEEADDGRSALVQIQKAQDQGQPFQFIISDWSMPGMSGLDLLKACKNDPKLKGIPFMLITAESDQKNIVDAAKAGVSDYAVKPISSTILKEKLDKIFTKTFGRKSA